MNFHFVQSKFYHSFLQTFNISLSLFVVPNMLSLKQSVFGSGPSKLTLQVTITWLLYGQPKGHTTSSHGPQQLILKAPQSNNKVSLERTHKLAGGGGPFNPTQTQEARGCHHGELICQLSQKSQRWRPCLIKLAVRKVKRLTRRIAVFSWDIIVNSSGS